MRDYVFKVKVEEHGYLDRILFGKLTTPAIDWAKKKNLTPNYLTTCSFISQLVSIYFLYHKIRFHEHSFLEHIKLNQVLIKIYKSFQNFLISCLYLHKHLKLYL